MKVTRISILDGKLYEMEIDVTPDMLALYVASGRPIQDAFPSLTPQEREFIKTGITPEEWTAALGEEPEE